MSSCCISRLPGEVHLGWRSHCRILYRIVREHRQLSWFVRRWGLEIVECLVRRNWLLIMKTRIKLPRSKLVELKLPKSKLFETRRYETHRYLSQYKTCRLVTWHKVCDSLANCKRIIRVDKPLNAFRRWNESSDSDGYRSVPIGKEQQISLSRLCTTEYSLHTKNLMDSIIWNLHADQSLWWSESLIIRLATG